MGSAAMDKDGNLAIGYSASNSQTFPAIRFTGRLAIDPLGTLTIVESDLRQGSGSQTHTSGRWGDYSMLAVDPTDGCTFWYTSEYYSVGASSAGWSTNIGSFKLGNCGGTARATRSPGQPDSDGGLVVEHQPDLEDNSDETQFRIQRCSVPVPVFGAHIRPGRRDRLPGYVLGGRHNLPLPCVCRQGYRQFVALE